jgi:hypothetical protein
MANAYEAIVGASPKLQIRTLAQPSNCAAADVGTLLVEVPLPADWLTDPGTGAKALAGVWTAAATAAGTAAHYRIKDAAGATHEQGSVTATGGGGDMVLQNSSIAAGQQVTVTAYSLVMPNA